MATRTVQPDVDRRALEMLVGAHTTPGSLTRSASAVLGHAPTRRLVFSVLAAHYAKVLGSPANAFERVGGPGIEVEGHRFALRGTVSSPKWEAWVPVSAMKTRRRRGEVLVRIDRLSTQVGVGESVPYFFLDPSTGTWSQPDRFTRQMTEAAPEAGVRRFAERASANLRATDCYQLLDALSDLQSQLRSRRV